MQNTAEKILVWLPSPMGDAILSTPALRAFRRRFSSCRITFLANKTVRQILSPSAFNDDWFEQENRGILATVLAVRRQQFAMAILLKNSFGCALNCALAGIPARVGYARDGRGALLTGKLLPERLRDGSFKPMSMVDYYLAIAFRLGADVKDSRLELAIDQQAGERLKAQLSQVFNRDGPLVILVPGAAGGASKCWLPDRFAQVADHLAANHNAVVVLSVAPNDAETQVAARIVAAAKSKLINLARHPLGLAELKALYAAADLVITNDTGPRHIAIALGKKVVTLVGPNNPAWTEIGYDKEIKIIGQAPCIPCDRPVCRQPQHWCMESISVGAVCEAADGMLGRPCASDEFE